MKILALDGNSIINRAFYGIRPLTTRDGRHTNAIYGFVNILMRLMENEQPDGVAIAFDLKAPTFRHKMYSDYKAGRKPMPEELAQQMPVLKELLKLMGHHCIELAGYEADDILGTLAASADSGDNRCVISTGDRDSLQLVSDKVKVLLAATKMGRPEIVTYDEAAIMEKYGVTPPQMIEIKALMGDSSDNIPGVAGIGEKTAGDLISRFHDIDYIYENIDTIDVKEGVRAKLKNGRESAFLSRTLGTICREVPIESDLEKYKSDEADREKLAAMFADLEFKKFIEKFGLDNVSTTVSKPEQAPLNDWKSAGFEAVFEESVKTGTADIVPAEDGFSALIGAGNLVCKIETDSFSAMADYRKLLENENIKKNLPDAKSFYHWCAGQGISPAAVGFDTSIAGYLLFPNGKDYSVESLCAAFGITAAEDDAFHQLYLHSALCKKLESLISENGMEELYYKIELPLTKVLCDMENYGFMVDVDGIRKYGSQLGERIDEIQKQIFELAGYEFNLNSPKQLGEALFEKMGLPAKKKTKSGYSTGAEILEELRFAHPAVELILQYRQLAKLKSTYCDGLPDKADKNGRIHSKFNQTETRTGRISSTDPNLQNIPVRQEEGRELRKFFKAQDGYVLCDADYSQIELRVLAHMAHDENMINGFLNHEDIHRRTASQVFGVPFEMVTPGMRSRAKAVNFGIVYGIGAFSLSKDIGVTRKEAEEYINSYFATYPDVKKFMDKSVADAKERGYAVTMYARRRDLPELKSSNGNLRNFGERVAKNMPIQGTAADIIKTAMLRVHSRIVAENLDARLILQVHDELIVEAKEDKAEYVCALLEQEMAAAAELAVPLIAEAHSGSTWYTAKS